MSHNNKIFVQIASYRDNELVSTIKDCLAKARYPDRLRFGICWQHDENENLKKYDKDERFRIIDCMWHQSKGVCWARHKIQKLYKGEKYTLQLDSHHRFSQDWDEQLIGMMEQTGSEKPIITACAPQYFSEKWVPGSDGPRDKDITPNKIVSNSFTSSGMIQLQSCPINNWQTLLKPLRARFLSCHFFFTLGDHCIECQYDPLLYFSEQEMNMTLRSYTMGYDLFHPHKSPVWHEYERSCKPKHWDDHSDHLVQEKKTDITWNERALRSTNRLQQLLLPEEKFINLGEYGLGSARSLEDYEKFAGIDFKNNRFHKDTLTGKEPPNSYIHPERWDAELFDIKASSFKRDEYFKFFSKKGVKYPASGNLSKPVVGKLSPGCQTCIKGKWSCIFITDACTRKCFYCPTPQHKKVTDNPPNGPEQLRYASADEYIKFLKKFDFEGISFSGGEPFLVVGRMLEYITKIRQCFGNKHHIWAYTNGDLVTKSNLSLLQQAGLNELRFDIAANNYDLTTVKKAIEYIETVTIEIPAIPEDIERLKSLLKELDKIGVKHLNLHQLMKTDHNSGKLDQRCYSPVNKIQYPKYTPIMESELAALEIIKHAIEIKSEIGINYCSSCYKARFQSAAHRKRAATFSTDKKFYLTETGYLSQLAIDASSDEAAYIENLLSKDQWEIVAERGRSELVFSVEHLDLLLKESYTEVAVIYYEPVITPLNTKVTESNSAEIFTDVNIVYQKNKKIRLALENNISAFLFYRLFLEKKNVESVANELIELYKTTEETPDEIFRDVIEFYGKFQNAEYLPIGLEPYE